MTDEIERRREALSPSEIEAMERTVSRLLTLLGRAQAMAILREFALRDEPLRFSDLEDALGCSPNTLSARLGELTAAGLLSRTAYDEMPPRVEYAPTEKARALFPAFARLGEWAHEHDLEE
jgi:DNA-binding HxlR family transcriptional regulator